MQIDQGSKVCNKIESFKADFHQRCMCDEIFTSTLRQATMHPTEGLLGDESEKTRELNLQARENRQSLTPDRIAIILQAIQQAVCKEEDR
jgi:hypothetical protein